MASKLWQYSKSTLKWTMFLPITLGYLLTRTLWRLIPLPLRKNTTQIFLLTLPLTIWPTLDGLIYGSLFAKYSLDQIPQQVEHWRNEQQRHSWMSYYNVPSSGVSIHDFQDLKPFASVPTLKSENWWQKLGFLKPDQDIDPVTAGLDRLGTLDGLVQVKRDNQDDALPRRALKEAWVYVTWWPMVDISWDRVDEKTNLTNREKRVPGNSWDEAFDALVRHSYANPLPHGEGSKLFYVDVMNAQFLSGIWSVKRPSLVHFYVKDDWTSTDSRTDSYRANAWWHDEQEVPSRTWTDSNGTQLDPAQLRPVSVRSIDLPLEDIRDMQLRDKGRIVFPSEFEQLKALIYSNGAWNEWPEYDQMHETMARFIEDTERMEHIYPVMRYFGTTQRWLKSNIFEQHEYMVIAYTCIQSLAFTLSWLSGALIWVASRLWEGITNWYLARPEDTNPLYGNSLHKDIFGIEPQGAGNFMNDMFLGVLDKMGDMLAANATESGAREKMTEMMASIMASSTGDTTSSTSTTTAQVG